MRHWTHLLWSMVVAFGAQAQQQPAPPSVTAVAFPFYNATQVLEGLHNHHLQPQAQHWHTQAQAMTLAMTQHCHGQTDLTAVRQAWLNSLQAWQRVGTPAIGPVLQRRTQREIDFWPVRPTLLAKGLAKQPQSVADLRTIGTPAKGYPALEQLLQHADQRLPAPECHYATLLAQAIENEANAVLQSTNTQPPYHWAEQPERTAEAFAEWINQWLAGLERLRWAYIEKPLRVHQSAGRNHHMSVEFARQTPTANLADWRAQWHSLYHQARLVPEQRQQPPQPGQSLIAIEALLIGKGHLAMAQRWAQALDQVEHRMADLTPSSGTRNWLATAEAMQVVVTLYQNEVASALDVPLGFSDADGD